MLWVQSFTLYKLIAQSVIKGTIELRCTAMSLQHTETLHFFISVDQQFSLVAVDSHQNYIFHGVPHVAGNEFICDPICKELPEKAEKTERFNYTWM